MSDVLKADFAGNMFTGTVIGAVVTCLLGTLSFSAPPEHAATSSADECGCSSGDGQVVVSACRLPRGILISGCPYRNDVQMRSREPECRVRWFLSSKTYYYEFIMSRL